jgi:hypothetical protein
MLVRLHFRYICRARKTNAELINIREIDKYRKLTSHGVFFRLLATILFDRRVGRQSMPQLKLR